MNTIPISGPALLKIITAAVIVLCVLAMTGCTSLHAYMYVLAMDYDGNAVLAKKENVKNLVLGIIENADNYTMRAFTRTAISYKIKKTENTSHSFYVITRGRGDAYQTLSFSATGKWATSKGAWAIDTDTDISSYGDYLEGINRWHVEEIETERGIDTLMTLTNVVEKMENNITYYYRAKVNNDDKIDNCNTAVLETLTENRLKPPLF
jgi:hypothetical protein